MSVITSVHFAVNDIFSWNSQHFILCGLHLYYFREQCLLHICFNTLLWRSKKFTNTDLRTIPFVLYLMSGGGKKMQSVRWAHI